MTPGRGGRGKGIAEAPALRITKNVEQTTVQHGVEAAKLRHRLDVTDVADDEGGTEVPLPGFVPGFGDGRRRHVDAGHAKTQARGHQSVLAGTASDVEDSAS